MRVPSLQTSRDTLQALQQRESDQTRLQSQIATGLRVQSPGDDPLAAAQAERARSRVARLAQEQRAVQLAQGSLSAADGALRQGVDLLQSAREALVAAGNAGYGADDRKALALQLRATREQLLAVANTPDGAGGYVFGGQGATQEPFTAESGAYAAAAGTQQVGAGAHATTVDGRAAFAALPQGNGVFVTASALGNTGTGWIGAGSVADATRLTGHAYTVTIAGTQSAPTYSVTDATTNTILASGQAFQAGSAIDVQGQRITISGTPAPGDAFTLAPAGRQGVFATLDDAIALLEDGTVAKPAYQERLERVQAGVDRALDGLQLARSGTGAQLRAADSAAAGGQLQAQDAGSRLSALRDLDLAQGISSLQTSQTAYEAALKSYSVLRKTSLFDLLS